MKHWILALFGKLSLSHIVADFDALIAKLDAHVERKTAEASRAAAQSQRLKIVAQEADGEAVRAASIKNNITNLIGG